MDILDVLFSGLTIFHISITIELRKPTASVRKSSARPMESGWFSNPKRKEGIHVRKILLLVLIFCLVLPLAACGDKGNNGTPAASSDGGSQGTGDPYLDSLPSRDYGMTDFNVLCTTQTEGFYNVTTEDQDPVSSSVYERNAAVEAKYKVLFKYTAMDGNKTGEDAFATAIRTAAQLDHGYDLIVGQQYYCLPAATEGNLQDLSGSEYLHWDEVWYSPKINDNASVNGKIYGASGSYIMSQISYAMATFYNKERWDALNTGDDLYQMVRDREWTYERLYEYAANYYTDSDNSNTKNDSDVFGYVYNGHGIAASIAASDTPITTRREDGSMTILDYYTPHLVNVFEDYFDFYNNSRGTYRRADDFGPAIMLASGNALFACAQLGVMNDCSELKNSNYHYGVLPMPLYDTEQSEYFTYTMRWELFYIPTNADFERSSIVLEYLNYTSEKYIIPAYWEEALTLRAADDEQDSEMMYIVRDALWYDFVTFFNHEIPMRDAVASQINNGSTRLSSWWNSNHDILEANLESVLQRYGT